MRIYVAISLIVLLTTSIRADDESATPPTAQPVDTESVKGTDAESAVISYEKAVQSNDETFQKQVVALQQDYLRKTDALYKNYLKSLRSAQAAETRKGKLDAALAIKILADSVEAAGPPAAPAVEGARRIQGRSIGWTVLFRSADPSIWNTNTNKGRNAFAIPLTNAPQGILYLKLAQPNGNCIIIPMNNREIGSDNRIGKGNYGWNGKGEYSCKAYHLGIYSDVLPRAAGTTAIRGGYHWYSGWGFGNHAEVDDVQGFAWEGQEIERPIFEISVKPGPLTEEEKANLRQ